jgi:hypothetical protein
MPVLPGSRAQAFLAHQAKSGWHVSERVRWLEALAWMTTYERAALSLVTPEILRERLPALGWDRLDWRSEPGHEVWRRTDAVPGPGWDDVPPEILVPRAGETPGGWEPLRSVERIAEAEHASRAEALVALVGTVVFPRMRSVRGPERADFASTGSAVLVRAHARHVASLLLAVKYYLHCGTLLGWRALYQGGEVLLVLYDVGTEKRCGSDRSNLDICRETVYGTLRNAGIHTSAADVADVIRGFPEESLRAAGVVEEAGTAS